MKPNVGRTILGGVAGTIAITLLMYVGAPMMGLPAMDIAGMLGGILGGWAMGMMMHAVNGIVIFPLLFAFVLFPRLPGTPVFRGILWGAALWAIAQFMVLPMMDAGILGLKTGGIMSAAASLMGHVIYGALLGWIAGPALPEKAGHPAAA
jgi:hypothetical protein